MSTKVLETFPNAFALSDNRDWVLFDPPTSPDSEIIIEETQWNYWDVGGFKETFTADPFHRLVFRVNISDLHGKDVKSATLTITRESIVIDEEHPLEVEAAKFQDNYLHYYFLLYKTDPTEGTPQPFASSHTVYKATDYQRGELPEQFTFDIYFPQNILPNTVYLEIHGFFYQYQDFDDEIVIERSTLGYYRPVNVIFTYEDSEPGPGPGVDPPTVSTPVFTIATPQEVDPDYAADLAGIWISGVSKAVVSAAVESETDNTSVSFTYSGHTEPVQMTLQGGFYVATTPTAVTQGMTFTVTANAGGLTGSSDPTTLNGVQAYSAPSVNVDDIFRCYWSGERADGGECYKLKISTNVSSLQDENYQEQNGITVLEVGILNASGNVVHLHNLSNNNNWQGPFADLDDEDAIYTIVVRIKDKVGRESETRVSINGKLLDIVMYRDTEYNKTHLGVGMKPDVSKGNGNATIQLPAGARIIVGNVDITDWLREQIGGTW